MKGFFRRWHSWSLCTLGLCSLGACPPAAGQSSAWIAAVDEYVPAPGQFVNTLPEWCEGDDAEAMRAKAETAIAGTTGGMITLGGWGGYVTFHFDHPVVNVPEERDLYIAGNATTGGSEAGIVMVSQDENCNGLPDDTWYELQGSADQDSTNVKYGYLLQYARAGDLQDIPWTDNQGDTGYIKRNAFHAQEYFPSWLDSPLLFNGTRLPNNAYDKSGNGTYWVLKPFRYGYVDNLPNSDTEANTFDIGWAVDPLTRQPVTLPYVDFVRVYTALNQSAGWLGETSTEVTGAKDLHPDAVAGISEVQVENKKRLIYDFDLLGRPVRRSLPPSVPSGPRSILWE